MEDGVSLSSASGSASGAGGSSSASSTAGEEVVLRINVPELKVEKCLQFHRDDIVWDVKQQALAALPKVGVGEGRQAEEKGRENGRTENGDIRAGGRRAERES